KFTKLVFTACYRYNLCCTNIKAYNNWLFIPTHIALCLFRLIFFVSMEDVLAFFLFIVFLFNSCFFWFLFCFHSLSLGLVYSCMWLWRSSSHHFGSFLRCFSQNA